jgi:RNA polymerase sigma-70 factor (ECF subfamily)
MMTLSSNQPQFPSEADTRPDPLDLERIYEEYVDQIYRFLYTRVGNREDAEDLTSQVFLKGFRRLDVERDGRSIASWLFTVARTVLADHWRQAYRYGPPAELHENLPGRSEVPDPWDDTAKVQRVDEVLARLPARSRSVLELRFLRGYSLEETARALGISIGNVKVIQHRALARAAELMDEGSASGTSSASADRAIA